MEINAKSSKADIIDAAIELTDTQAETIQQQEEQLKFLAAVALVTSLWAIVF